MRQTQQQQQPSQPHASSNRSGWNLQYRWKTRLAVSVIFICAFGSPYVFTEQKFWTEACGLIGVVLAVLPWIYSDAGDRVVNFVDAIVEHLPHRYQEDVIIIYQDLDYLWSAWAIGVLRNRGYLVKRSLWNKADEYESRIKESAGSARRLIIILSPYYMKMLGEKQALKTFATYKYRGKYTYVTVPGFTPGGPVLPITPSSLMGRQEDDADALTAICSGIEPRNAPVAGAKDPYYPGNLPPVWNIPEKNPYFVGRKDILDDLSGAFRCNGDGGLRMLAMTGLGGMGKASIAIEYTYEHRSRYQYALWISIGSPDEQVKDLKRIAEQVTEMHEKSNSGPNAEVQKIKEALEMQPGPVAADLGNAIINWLERQENWLLVLEHCDSGNDPQQAKMFIPRQGRGAVLLTGAKGTLELALGRSIDGKKVGMMAEDDAALLLLRQGKILTLNQSLKNAKGEDQKSAKELVQLLGRHPEAISYAGMDIASSGESVQDYLKRYKRERPQIMHSWQTEYVSHTDHPGTLFSWLSIFEEIQESNPQAANLLRICSFLAPTAIPWGLFEKFADVYLVGHPKDSMLTAVVRELNILGFVERQNGTVTVNRLVQDVLRDRMTKAERTDVMDRAVRLLNGVFLPGGFTTWRDCQRTIRRGLVVWRDCNRYLPHALACIEHIRACNLHAIDAVRLLYSVGWLKKEQTEYKEARCLLEEALKIRKRLDSSQAQDDPDVATCRDSLAELYRVMGKYEDAERECRAALQWRETELGANHRDVACSLYNLAELQRTRGQYAEAKLNYEKARIIFEAQGDNLDRAMIYSGLGNLYDDWGLPPLGKGYFTRALDIREQVFKRDFNTIDHPDVAVSKNNLAHIYYQEKAYTEADALYKMAVEICEETLESSHLEAVQIRANRGALMIEQIRGSRPRDDNDNGQIAPRAYYLAALKTYKDTFDAPHIQIAKGYHDVAGAHRLRLHQRRPDYEKAVMERFKKALENWSLDSSAYPHPLHARIMQDYAEFIGENLETLAKINNRAWRVEMEKLEKEAEELDDKAQKILEAHAKANPKP